MTVTVDVRIEFDPGFLQRLEKAKQTALEMTGEALRGDLIISQTMPMASGHLQNESTFVDTSVIGLMRLVSSTPYARRLYFNPIFNFRTDKNPFAGGRWFDPYLPGHAKGNFIPQTYAHFLDQQLGG